MHFDKKKSIKIIITEKSDKADWALKSSTNIKAKVVIF